MNSKKIAFFTFILVALVQVYVPAKMILDREDVLANGQEFKFKTAPIDPNDPFIGKYITLSYAENTVQVPKKENWTTGEPVYVSLTTDTTGFAKIKSISKDNPTNNQVFVKAKVGFLMETGSSQVIIDYPFDRYYMEESKAYDAEQLYRQLQQDTTRVTYALVSIKNGNAVLKDVLIGETSIREIVKANQTDKAK